MSILTTLKFAIVSLHRNKIRTFLTILGIVIGIAAVIVVIAAGEGMKSLVNGQLTTFGNDYIVVEIKIPNTSHLSTENATGISQGVSITTLKREDMEAIKKLPNVMTAYAAVMGQSLVAYGNNNKQIFLMGTTAEVVDIDTGKIAMGRYYTEEEEKSIARVAVLGLEVKEALFGDDNPIGRTIKIKKMGFKVIGVLEKKGAAGGMNMDQQIFIPLKTLQKQVMGIDHVSFIMVKYIEANLADQTADDIAILMRERHEIEDPDKDDFSVTTQAEAMNMMNAILGGVQLLLVALAGISLIVGGVGIMNIMYVSVAERTFEIGLRQAVGATSNNILRQFLFEAVAVTVVGGIIGLITGVGITFMISWGAKTQGYDWPFAMPLTGVAVSIFSATIVGLIFGIYPARKAAKMDPINALRQE